MTYREALKRGSLKLREQGITDADNDAWLLLEFTAQITRTFLFVHGTDEMPENILLEYEDCITRRAAHIPLQHITGEQAFMGLDFYVNPSVLVPRQDTETLVEEALKFLREGMKILDMCTGSGCILVSLLHYGKNIEGVGSDISAEALETAEQNARRNQVRAEFIQSDLFEQITGKFDLIVSNPPYIPTAVIKTLDPEVADHDPYAALDGKEDGLYFYRKIIKNCRQYLTENGKILFEIGYDQGKDVSDMLKYEGFRNVRIIRDLSLNDRVVIGEL